MHLAHCSLELHGICCSECQHPMRHRRSAAARSTWWARFIFLCNTCRGCKSAPPHVPVGLDQGRASGRAAVRTPCVFARQALLFVSLSSGFQFSHRFSDFGLKPGSEQSLDALAKVRVLCAARRSICISALPHQMVSQSREGQPREFSSPTIPRTHAPTDALHVQSVSALLLH